MVIPLAFNHPNLQARASSSVLKYPIVSYQNEEEIRLLKEQVEMLRQQVSKLEETNTLLIRAIKEQIGINF